MVWVSTKKSLRNREVSFLAILEIFFATLIYWGVAIYYNTYWHIVTSIVITPIFLLSSPSSIKYGLKLLYGSSEKKEASLKLSTLILICIFLFFFFLHIQLLLYMREYGLDFIALLIFLFFIIGFFLGLQIILGLSLFESQNSQKTEEPFVQKSLQFLLYSVIVPISISFGISLSVFIVSTIYKTIAVILHLKSGYKRISRNWFTYCFVVDLKKTPEIMLGIEEKKSISKLYKLSTIYEVLKIKNNFIGKIVFLSIYLFLYPLAISYRLSLKSTFWFYIPLLFIIKSPTLDTSKDIGKFLSELYQTIWAWIRFILALITLGAFFITYYEYYPINNIEFPLASIVTLLYLDFSSIEVWKIFQVLVAILTILLFIYSNAIRTPRVSNNISLEYDFHVKTIFYLNSLRNWLSVLYLLSAFIFLATFFKVWEYSYVPNFFNGFLTTLLEYIQYVPFK